MPYALTSVYPNSRSNSIKTTPNVSREGGPSERGMRPSDVSTLSTEVFDFGVYPTTRPHDWALVKAKKFRREYSSFESGEKASIKP